MKKFAEILTVETDEKLRGIRDEHDDPMVYSEKAIKVLIIQLEKLKSHFLKQPLQSKTEEITFFRDVKPEFASRLIYYNEVYNIAARRPIGSKKVLREYYRAELKKLNQFFQDNAEFYKYYRTGNRLLDAKYFMRGKHDVKCALDSYYLQADRRFSTTHDFKVAMIIANDLIKLYLEGELLTLSKKSGVMVAQPVKNLKWTGSKVGLVELVYALQAEGVFNNGSAGLNEIATGFQLAFGIELGQLSRTFTEIRARKFERSRFLSTLAEKLLQRMELADGTK